MEEKKTTVRHCRKCLTRDMDWGEYFDNLHAYIAQLDENIKTQEPLYEERLLKCQSCAGPVDAMLNCERLFKRMSAPMASGKIMIGFSKKFIFI